MINKMFYELFFCTVKYFILFETLTGDLTKFLFNWQLKGLFKDRTILCYPCRFINR